MEQENTSNKNVILVPTDFTKIGDYAIENAAEIAKELKFNVCILHVINKTTRKKLAKENKPVEYINEKLEKITKDLEKSHRIKADYLSKEGSIFSMIAEAAKDINASYIVIGTHGKKPIQVFLGSFALKVIKSSPVPVFVVKKPPMNNKIESIVFPLDVTIGSKRKVKHVVNFNKTHKTKFHLFINSQGDVYTKSRIKGDLNQVKKILENHKIEYIEAYSEKKIPYAKQLVSYAKENNCNFIMITTDPEKTSIQPFGSTDERVIYNEDGFPVMCINLKSLGIHTKLGI